MQDKIITIYCFLDELLNALGHHDDKQAILTTAEVMTVALVAAEFFAGCHQHALTFLSEHRYLKPLSKSRFNRRLHAIPECLWQSVLAVLAQCHQDANPAAVHLVDTLPVPVCHNIRISRCRLYQGEDYRNWCEAKKQYFFGLKVCLIVTAGGAPIEFVLFPGGFGDITCLRSMPLELPPDSTLIADAGFTDYGFEDDLIEAALIRLLALRKKNSLRPHPGWLVYWCQYHRKRVETTFSQLTERLARSIHAVTPRGFELKVFLTVLAFSLVG